MKIQKQPDYLIFADSAKKGENAEFPDISRGWGITTEQTASKPPMEWMNGAFNRIDKNMLYLLQQGVPEWSELVTYPVNAIIKYNGVLYTAIAENDNAKPSTNTTTWKKTQAEILSASTAQKGIVQLSSATDSESETDAATPKAVKTVNDDVKKRVPSCRKINDRQLDADITLSADDVKALPAEIKTDEGKPLLDENGKPAYEVGNATDFKNGLKSGGENVLTKKDLPEQTGIGINQKWVNVTENRKNGITYTNTTGKTIVVCINVDFNADSGQLLIDDVLVATRLFDGTGARSFITFVVPHNSTYQINNSSAIWSWSELR